MWGHRNFMQDPMVHNAQRGFATCAVDKMLFRTTAIPLIQNVLHISPNKRFTNPNYVNKHTTTLSEQCANFINNYNGYPNNMRKDVETKHKPPRKRKNHNKHTLGMDIKEDIDEIGVDVVNDSACITEPQSAHKSTLEDFIPTKELIVSLPSSPIQIKISTGYSISPKYPMSPTISVSSKICSMSPTIPKICISPGASNFRRMSDCNSEDNFVIFERGEESCTESEWSDEDEDDEDTGDESDFIDFNDNSCKNTPKTEFMMRFPSKMKKVHFAPDKDLVQVHKMCAWSYAYWASRKGNWDQYARDRERFQRRIDECAVKIDRILTPEHRLSIYRQRFEVDDT